jgi:hypothetical protein
VELENSKWVHLEEELASHGLRLLLQARHAHRCHSLQVRVLRLRKDKRAAWRRTLARDSTRPQASEPASYLGPGHRRRPSAPRRPRQRCASQSTAFSGRTGHMPRRLRARPGAGMSRHVPAATSSAPKAAMASIPRARPRPGPGSSTIAAALTNSRAKPRAKPHEKTKYKPSGTGGREKEARWKEGR